MATVTIEELKQDAKELKIKEKLYIKWFLLNNELMKWLKKEIKLSGKK